ncbi:unnamed protein product [Rhizophagus irregularis]|nr:unnamed protein product [Rhizophagus irregularis]CAB5392002.1 unnamed protein product [Rhizophagus irregularis]
MYCKRLDNFQVQHQLQKNNRNRKQKRRFERACKSPLHTSKDYGFQIPHAAIILLTIDNTIPITEAIDTIAPPSNDIPIPSEEGKTWHPTLGILIEDELFPYVLTDPIYKTKNCHKRGKDPLTPGSRLWLEAMKNHRAYVLEQKNINEIQQQYKEKAKLWNTSEYRYQFRKTK